MTPQATLTTFSPQPEAPCYGCETCVLNQGIVMIGDGEKVRCRGMGLREVRRTGCGGWWDGGDRAGNWPRLPDNYRTPKKYRAREGMA